MGRIVNHNIETVVGEGANEVGQQECGPPMGQTEMPHRACQHDLNTHDSHCDHRGPRVAPY